MSESNHTPDPERLSAALDRELPADEQAAMEAELEADESFRAEFLRLQAVKRVTHRAVNAEPLPDGLFTRLQAALDADLAQSSQATPEPVRRAPRPRRGVWTWLGVAAAAAVAVFAVLAGRSPSGSAAQQPRIARIEVNPMHLAMSHAMWHQEFAGAQSGETPEAMAAGLSRKLGYQVRPPDLSALDAELRACTTCDHSVPGSDVAMFVMAKSNGDAISLYEFRAPPEQVSLVGFEPTATPGYAAAAADGLSFLTWADGDLRVCLVAADTPVEELLEAAPSALRVAQARTSYRVAGLF